MKGKPIITRLKLLSLAIEDAVKNDDLESINPMLSERTDLINRLANLEPMAEWVPELRELQKIDERLSAALYTIKTATALELKSMADAKTGLRKYGDNRRASNFDQAG